MESTGSEIQKFYSGQTIFLTGASGFLGKLVVEKLLRSCPDLKHIYIILREKKGRTPEDRFKEIFNVTAFDILKGQQPDFLSKISIIQGDLELPCLGLSDVSKSIVKEEVNCIFHVGASVRFHEKIKKAAYINVKSVRDLLRMAKDMTQLKSFVYVSTAFSNCTRKDIDEVFYEPIITGGKLLDLIECLDDEMLLKITPALLQDFPNTYVFTKAIAEDIIRKESTNLPVSIVRPSIVISTCYEPIPGWIDTLYGPVSILMGVALGLLRTLHADERNVADLVPVDFVINSILALGWDAARQNKTLEKQPEAEDNHREPKIFNYVSRPQNPITWGEYRDLSNEFGVKIPSPLIIWHSTFTYHPNYYQHRIMAFLTQTIPAYVVDFIARLIGKKPMFVKAIEKVDKFCNVISYFCIRQWNFKNKNVQDLWAELNEADRKLFNFDMKSMTWRDYFPNYLMGGRLYILKDPIDTIPQGRRKLLAVKIGHYVLVSVLCFLFFQLLKLLWDLF